MAFWRGVLDKLELNKDTLEAVIGIGRTQAETLESFKMVFIEMARADGTIGPDEYNVSKAYMAKKMNDWCKENYNGLPFATVYEIVQNIVYNTYLDMMSELSVRGNPMAQSLMNEFILKKKEENIVQINFINSLPLESEEDKENDK